MSAKLDWEPLDGFTEWRGYLPAEPGTTLFLVGVWSDDFGGKGFTMRGAFVPDDEEDNGFGTIADARVAAESKLAEWIERHTYGWRISDEDLIKEHEES